MRWRRVDRTEPGAESLRQRCEARVRALRLPRGAAIQVVCERIGDARGRPIQVVPLDLPIANVDGLWVSTSDVDYIAVERRLAPVHRDQVILHELGHLICDHDSTPLVTLDALGTLFGSLDPKWVARVLAREHTRSEAELEAELVGSLIARRIGAWTASRGFVVPPEARDLARRLSDLLEPGER